jgi:leader peptidase (prepilin peptidase)/N-methyltransferase
MLAGLVLAFALPEAWGVHGRLHALALSATGLVVAGGLMALLALSGRFLFKREALGWGDVKFIAAAGALLGLLGPLFAVFAGSLLGSVYGIGRALLSKRRRRRPIAFGPFLAAGALLWILFGRRLLELYLEVVNPMLGR